MEFKLIYLECFESEFKGKKYVIYRFLDPNSLNILSGTDLNLSFEPYKVYKCRVEFTHNKLKVISAQE